MSVSTLLRAGIAAAALLSAVGAWAQAHEATAGPYVLRASTVSSMDVHPETAARHGIVRGPRTAVLNVTVIRKDGGGERTVAADVRAVARNLTGLERAVPMRDTSANGYVSYAGAYPVAHREVIDFVVSATPEGSGTPIRLSFRDRMWSAAAP